jgi:hypothetical protein
MAQQMPEPAPAQIMTRAKTPEDAARYNLSDEDQQILQSSENKKDPQHFTEDELRVREAYNTQFHYYQEHSDEVSEVSMPDKSAQLFQRPAQPLKDPGPDDPIGHLAATSTIPKILEDLKDPNNPLSALSDQALAEVIQKRQPYDAPAPGPGEAILQAGGAALAFLGGVINVPQHWQNIKAAVPQLVNAVQRVGVALGSTDLGALEKKVYADHRNGVTDDATFQQQYKDLQQARDLQDQRQTLFPTGATDEAGQLREQGLNNSIGALISSAPAGWENVTQGMKDL